MILELLLYLIVKSVDIFLTVVIFAMLARSVMSLFMVDEGNIFYVLAFTVTEPFVFPVRSLFERMGWFQGTPIDVSFFCAAVCVMLVQTALSFVPLG